MFAKTAVVLSCLAIVLVAGIPTLQKQKEFIHKRVTVTPNKLGLPTKPQPKYFEPQIRIPGTKAVPGCGPVMDTSERIVGGTEATPHSYPWQVALYIDGLYFCGGSLISDEWVLTAAHCMDGAFEVRVVAGAHDLSASEASQISQISTTFTVHENWVSAVVHNDLSVIKLNALPMSAEVAPVCLPAYSTPDLVAGDMVTATGWGKTQDGLGGISDTLNEVTVPVITNAECAAYYGDLIVTEDMVCISAAGGHGTCNGDSGGPLNYMDGGKYYTHGITSFGSSEGCESGAPDSFTRVTHYLAWIETNTGIMIDP